MEIIKKRIGQYKESCFNNHISEEIIELIVPDNQPDFENLISCFAICKISEKSVLSGSIKVTGQIISTVHYSSTASECAYTINATSDFAVSIKCEKCNPGDILISHSKVLSTTVEIVNSRKIKIKVILSTAYTIFNLHNIDVIEDICGEVGESVHSLTYCNSICPCVDISEKAINFTEEVSLSDSEYNNLFRIIRWQTDWYVDETKIMHNRIMIRGHVSLNIFSTNEHNFEVVQKSYVLPFSQVMDCKNTYDNDEVLVSIVQDNCNIKLLQKEDNNYLYCECCATASALTYRQMDIKYLCDVYSTVYETDAKMCNLNLPEQTSTYSATNYIEARIESINAIENVIDYSIISSYVLINNELQLRFHISAICTDVMGTICSSLGYVETKASCCSGILGSSIKIHINDIKTNIDSAGILFSFNILLNGLVETSKEINTVMDCSIDKSKKRGKASPGNLILRKVLPGETVWSISKHYGTSCDAIKSANNLDDNSELPIGKLIIVPFVKQ